MQLNFFRWLIAVDLSGVGFAQADDMNLVLPWHKNQGMQPSVDTTMGKKSGNWDAPCGGPVFEQHSLCFL
jgi:hypothetical protein